MQPLLMQKLHLLALLFPLFCISTVFAYVPFGLASNGTVYGQAGLDPPYLSPVIELYFRLEHGGEVFVLQWLKLMEIPPTGGEDQIVIPTPMFNQSFGVLACRDLPVHEPPKLDLFTGTLINGASVSLLIGNVTDVFDDPQSCIQPQPNILGKTFTIDNWPFISSDTLRVQILLNSSNECKSNDRSIWVISRDESLNITFAPHLMQMTRFNVSFSGCNISLFLQGPGTVSVSMVAEISKSDSPHTGWPVIATVGAVMATLLLLLLAMSIWYRRGSNNAATTVSEQQHNEKEPLVIVSSVDLANDIMEVHSTRDYQSVTPPISCAISPKPARRSASPRENVRAPVLPVKINTPPPIQLAVSPILALASNARAPSIESADRAQESDTVLPQTPSPNILSPQPLISPNTTSPKPLVSPSVSSPNGLDDELATWKTEIEAQQSRQTLLGVQPVALKGIRVQKDQIPTRFIPMEVKDDGTVIGVCEAESNETGSPYVERK